MDELFVSSESCNKKGYEKEKKEKKNLEFISPKGLFFTL